MPRTKRIKLCELCGDEYETTESKAKYCSHSCSAKCGNAKRKMSDEAKKKISESLKKYYKNNPHKIRRGAEAAEAVAKTTRGKFNKNPKSILDLAKKTVSKILARLKIGCSNCGWDECVCDVHHIIPKSKGGSNDHSNLTYLCPNCHRLAHSNKLPVENLTTFEDFCKDEWLKHYYG